MIKLRPYQQKTLDLVHDCDADSVLVVQPTGTGKTIEFVYDAIHNYKRTLILTWSVELIEQVKEACALIDPSVSVGVFLGQEKDLDSQITVASVQTLKSYHNIAMIDRDYELVVVDEAHHISMTLKRILYAFGLCDLNTAGHQNVMYLEPDFSVRRKLTGWTATPERTDGESLRKIFRDRVDTPPIEWFIEKESLCDLKFISVDTGIDMSDVRSYAGDLSEKEIAEKFIESGYMKELARVVDKYLSKCEHILLYVPTADTAVLAAKLINLSGISADYVIGRERDRREIVIDNFKRGKIRVLVNCLVLKEGFDAPCTDGIILCRPTKSQLLLRQIIGRGTRTAENKTICTVVDLVVNRRQSDIVSASGIFDSTPLSKAPEQENLSVREKILYQKQFSAGLSHLSYVLGEIHLKKSLEAEKKRQRRVKKDNAKEVFFVKDVPDSVSLLLDTRILRSVGLDAKSFSDDFASENAKLKRGKPFKSWSENKTPHPYQIEYLKEHTGYPEEDLSLMSPMDAQSFINVLERHKRPTSDGRRRLLMSVYKIPANKIPEKDIDASRLIRRLNISRFTQS